MTAITDFAKRLAGLLTAMVACGAAMAVTPAPMADRNGVVDNTPDSILQARMARPVAGSTRQGENPVLFLVGNSTMRTGTKGNGSNGQWGWGYFFPELFDRNQITVENHALGGMSTRTFYNKLWGDVISGVRPGDYVIIELGHNDNGPYDEGRARASIPGIGRDSLNVVIKETGERETVYSYGEYLRRYVNDVREHGGEALLLSLTPRLAYDAADTMRIERVADTYGRWAREVADEMGVAFIDLNEISARKYERFGREKTAMMFYLDKIHTSELGARENALSAAEGLIAAGHPLARMLKPLPRGMERPEGRVRFIVGNDIDGCTPHSEPGVTTIDCRAPDCGPREYIDSGRWEKVYRALREGDVVEMHFTSGSGDEELLPDEESRVIKEAGTGRYKVVYPRRKYLRLMTLEANEMGAKVVAGRRH